MELTAAAQGLNSFFFGYDSTLLGALHSVAEGVGVVMTPLMKLITLLGEKGLIFFLLALVFCRASAGDGELAFFLALDVAEDLARRAAAKRLVFHRFFTPRVDVAYEISIAERATMLGSALLHPAIKQDGERDERHEAQSF